MNKQLSAVLALAAALLAPASWAHDDDDRDSDGRPVSEHRPLKPDAKVDVTNIAGLIDVEAWDKNELYLTGTLSEEVEKLEITGNESSLRIEVKVPKRARNIGDTDLHLMVPAGVTLEAEGVSADIRVKGLRGPVDAHSVSGDVRVNVSSTRVSAATVSGDVMLEAPSTDTKVDSVSGDVVVKGAKGQLRGKSVSGDVRIQAREVKQLDAETVSGDVELDLDLERGAEISAESLSGCVHLALPKMPEGAIEMETFSGELESAWSSIPESAKEFHSDGNGKGRVRLHSFSGDISLKKR